MLWRYPHFRKPPYIDLYILDGYSPNPPTDLFAPHGWPSKPPTFKTGCWMRKDGLKPSQVGVYKYCKLCYYGNKLIYIYTYIYNMLIIIYQYNMLFPQRTFIHSLSLSVQICIWLYRLYVYVYMHLIHSWCIGSHNQTILLHWTSSGNTPADSPWPHCLTSISHPTKYIRGFVWGIIDFTTIKKNGHQFINLKVLLCLIHSGLSENRVPPYSVTSHNCPAKTPVWVAY
jgi:hypothetical protein